MAQWTSTEIVVLIERFLAGTGGRWDWDDFESVPLKDPSPEAVRLRCVSIQAQFPSTDGNSFASPEGLAALRRIGLELSQAHPEIVMARRRAREVALAAKSLRAGTLDSGAFFQTLEASDYDNPFVQELLDRLEHEPSRGGVFGMSTGRRDRYIEDTDGLIARALSETANVAV